MLIADGFFSASRDVARVLSGVDSKAYSKDSNCPLDFIAVRDAVSALDASRPRFKTRIAPMILAQTRVDSEPARGA